MVLLITTLENEPTNFNKISNNVFDIDIMY
jgi:hypothetical protein